LCGITAVERLEFLTPPRCQETAIYFQPKNDKCIERGASMEKSGFILLKPSHHLRNPVRLQVASAFVVLVLMCCGGLALSTLCYLAEIMDMSFSNLGIDDFQLKNIGTAKLSETQGKPKSETQGKPSSCHGNVVLAHSFGHNSVAYKQHFDKVTSKAMHPKELASSIETMEYSSQMLDEEMSIQGSNDRNLNDLAISFEPVISVCQFLVNEFPFLISIFVSVFSMLILCCKYCKFQMQTKQGINDALDEAWELLWVEKWAEATKVIERGEHSCSMLLLSN
jgi:hypothetical protein